MRHKHWPRRKEVKMIYVRREAGWTSGTGKHRFLLNSSKTYICSISLLRAFVWVCFLPAETVSHGSIGGEEVEGDELVGDDMNLHLTQVSFVMNREAHCAYLNTPY